MTSQCDEEKPETKVPLHTTEGIFIKNGCLTRIALFKIPNIILIDKHLDERKSARGLKNLS